jgi:hypothetical protein
MTFLFGDSSPSDLRIDYIELLRDALDFAVQVLLADERMKKGVQRVDEARKNAEAELARLQALGGVVNRAVEGAEVGAADSPTAQCAHELLIRASDTVRMAGDRVQAQVTGESNRVEEEARRDREKCVEALGGFLKRHDLPVQTSELRLQHEGGEKYVARLYVKGLTDLQAVLDLDIAPAHALAHVLRVEKLVERLEVHAPEAGGWLRKEVKLRPQRLDKEFITAAVIGEHDTSIQLRASADGNGVGYDLVYRENQPRVTLRRVGEASDLPPFDLDDTDSAKARELKASLVTATNELIKQRKQLIEAALGKVPLYDFKDPRVMVERLMAEMAPTVREIAKRSLTRTELVLKRQTGDGRREEIFVSRVDLQNKLRPLGDTSRALFAPLELGEIPAAEPPPPSGPQPGGQPHAGPPAATQPKVKTEAKVEVNLAKDAGKEAVTRDLAKEPASESAKAAAAARRSTLFGEALGAEDSEKPRRPRSEESIPIDDSFDRLVVSDAAAPKK